jgi:hypothetical protein
MVAWNAAKTYSSDNQAYYTNNDLASQVIKLAKRYKGPCVELGVGNGALFKGLWGITDSPFKNQITH